MLKPKLSKNALLILRERYLKKDGKGRIIETPQEMFLRVAKNVALADAKYLFSKSVKNLQKTYHKQFWELTHFKFFKRMAFRNKRVRRTAKDFYRMMASLEFLPNSPCLFNAGRKLQQLSACFVLPIEDDLDSIFQAVKYTALIHRSGGGTGFDFSKLRPEGEHLERTDGRAAGPLKFMNVFDAAVMHVKQSGRRQGANMGILRIDHPDIEAFAQIKSDPAVLHNFNISVAVTDEFMKTLQRDGDWILINPLNGKRVRKIKARRLLRLIAAMAHKNADPGMVFIDRINTHNPTPKIGTIAATNPCAEMPLLPYEACNLGSVNLARHVKEGLVDWEKLRQTVQHAVHFLDNMIDVCAYPLPEIMDIAHKNRKIGLGVMGFADLLFQLRVPYDSQEAVLIAQDLMRFINEEAKKASAHLAKARGVFPNFKNSTYHTGKAQDRVRNATRTAISPTGSISLIANCSSGIEPVYALAYSRPLLGSSEPLVLVNASLLQELKKHDLYSKRLLKKISKNGKIRRIQEIHQDIRNIFVTAMEIDPSWHVRLQAAFQKYTDNAVSKTVNLPKKATIRDVEKVFLDAYESGCKGITVYVDKSKKAQILSAGANGKKRCPTCGA